MSLVLVALTRVSTALEPCTYEVILRERRVGGLEQITFQNQAVSVCMVEVDTRITRKNSYTRFERVGKVEV